MPRTFGNADGSDGAEHIETYAGVLEKAWQEARLQILNAARVSGDVDIWMLSDPAHMGDPAHKIDQWLQQRLNGWLATEIPDLQILGEEQPPSNLVLDPRVFNRLAYVDALELDGTRQALTLPGGWSIKLAVQKYIGIGVDGLPECSIEFLGVVDAEGGTVLWSHELPYVELRIIGSASQADEIFSDQLVLNEGEEFVLTGRTTVVVGGYKALWWEGVQDSEIKSRTTPFSILPASRSRRRFYKIQI
jgi:hypothetical protein